MALTPVEDALAILLADANAPLRHEPIALDAAFGRILAVDIYSAIDVPPADNSAMDGYAVRAADVVSGKSLRVSQRITAGTVGAPLEPGTAARIFTGAEIPPGADAVVMQENCRQIDAEILVGVAPQIGENVRPRGQDIRAGNLLVASGSRLNAADVALLASVGLARVSVFPQLVVTIFSTGDELVEPGQPLLPGQIYNSNRPLLTGLLRELGCVVRDLGIVRDTAADTADILRRAVSNSDCVISTGGVSAGEEDHVREQLEKLGALKLWKLNIKPGKPLAYGRLQNTPFFGLPGNPVSAFVTFIILVKPFLQQLQGGHRAAVKPHYLPAAFTWDKPGNRQEYLRARIVVDAAQRKVVELFPNQSSGALTSVAWANALVVIAPQQTVQCDDRVAVIPLE